MDKKRREELEYKSLFCDEKFARRAWRDIISSSLESSGKALPEMMDPKTEQPTYLSEVDRMAYQNVKTRLLSEGKDREPMQAELIVECGIIRARTDNSVWNTLLERTAGKVKDELSISSSPFEDLTDEELEVLAIHRSKPKK